MTHGNNWIMHPGEILREEFLNPLGISVWRLAKETHVPVTRLHKIVHEERSVTIDTALRLAKFFATTPEFWLNMQRNYDLKKVLNSDTADINSIVPCTQPELTAH